MKIKQFIEDNVSLILAGVSIGGLGISTFLTINGTMKAIKKLESTDISNKDTLAKKIRIIAPKYIPAMVSLLATSYAIIRGSLIAENDKKALSSACASIAGSMITAKKAIGKNVTQDQMTDIRKDIMRSKEPPKHIEDGCKLFWFELLEDYAEVTNADFYNAKCELNRMFAYHGYVNAADFFDILGIKMDANQRAVLKSISWTWEDEPECDYSFIDISTSNITLDCGIECTYVTFMTTPSADPEDREQIAKYVTSDIAYRDDVLCDGRVHNRFVAPDSI